MSKQIQLSESDITRFWSHVDKSGECWPWTAYRSRRGYGQFGLGDEVLKAHRVAYVIAYGQIPDGMEVCHHCDNPSCVRPEHLFAGTHSDNMRDCANKGHNMLQRHPELRRGEKHPLAKLTAEQVIQIRQSDLTPTQLSKQFNVSRWMIRRILSRLAWKHI